MCTVTFVPSGNHYFITSSRDEQTDRARALFPEIYEVSGRRLLFPKDPKGGGSWIAVSDSGNVIVLLNGAIKPHLAEPPYRKSRGLILIDLISQASPADAFEETEFTGIEPFTVILFDDKKLYSGKWDGRMKWLESLDPGKPHIWSSVTLYDSAAIHRRESWFRKWVAEKPYPGSLDIIHFHQKGGDGDPTHDILMKRGDMLSTTSISAVRLTSQSAGFRYLDLLSGETRESHLLFSNQISIKA